MSLTIIMLSTEILAGGHRPKISRKLGSQSARRQRGTGTRLVAPACPARPHPWSSHEAVRSPVSKDWID